MSSWLFVDAHRNESSWITELLLENTNRRIEVAGNAEEAIELNRSSQYEAVFINAILPDMAGTTLASLFRKLSPDLLIFVVANIKQNDKARNLWQETAKSKAILLPLPIRIERVFSILQIGDDHQVIVEQDEQNEQNEHKNNAVLKINEKESFREITKPREFRKKKGKDNNKCPVVLLYSWKGGVGKTTTAVNLAATVQIYTALSVGVVELTRQTGNMLSHFALTPSITVRDWIDRPPKPEEALSNMLEDPATGLYVLPTQTLLDESERSVKITEDHTMEIVDKLREELDLLVIDGGTILDDVLYTLLNEADHILLISDMNMETLQENHYMPEIMRRRGINIDKLIHVLNRAENGLGITEKEAIGMVEAPIAHVINSYKRVKQRREVREPFVVSDAKHPYANQIKLLAAHLLPNAAELQVRTGFIKKVLGKISTNLS